MGRIRSKCGGLHRAAVITFAVTLGGVLLVGCSGSAKIAQLTWVHIAQAIVPVVVQANGDDITSRVRGAHIDIVDTATGRAVGSEQPASGASTWFG